LLQQSRQYPHLNLTKTEDVELFLTTQVPQTFEYEQVTVKTSALGPDNYSDVLKRIFSMLLVGGSLTLEGKTATLGMFRQELLTYGFVFTPFGGTSARPIDPDDTSVSFLTAYKPADPDAKIENIG
jgi:hypothetical protein